ncbi:nitrogen fixation negative regulator NifL [Rhodobium orientis]|uniref:histidine kinase n=1 Tax=Rhodobium orientis TaxID=34017 RepID=A0A327JJ68_9HYPH|nr:nitrogen fixation negative regulator NifL [Rhodobium orientis]MBB4304370.1 nitrogen fixation negative regulator NifL [Rhodobium orientis]MBK5951976.1 nitrogen fixation negative regulator NifL [Rhodobium orientis]RAI25756.1 nitrogen fixation negative regulator NifL [Rhodobium orientis]
MSNEPGKEQHFEACAALTAILSSLPDDLPPEVEEIFGPSAMPVDGSLPPRLYRETVEQLSVAISVTDTEANIVYVNPAFEALTGYAVKDVVGQNEALLSAKATPRAVYLELWKTISGGETWHGKLVNRKKSGERYLAELTIVPVKNRLGTIRYYLGMHRDITEINHLQRQVENQKNLIESIIDSAPVVMALVDVSGKAIIDNRAYKRLAHDMGDAVPAEYFLDELRPLLGDDMQSACEEERTLSGVEVRVLIPGMRVRWFSCSTIWVREFELAADSYFESRLQNALLLVCNEVTNLKSQYEHARFHAVRAEMTELEMRRNLTEVIEGALYQLQGPLNVIQAMAGMLSRRDGADGALSQATDAALMSGQQAIERLKTALPPESPPVKAPVNLNQVIRDVLVMSANRLSAAGIVVDWTPERDLAPVYGQENLLRILLKTLIDNAITAVGEPGAHDHEVRITTIVTDDGMIETVIRDGGPGIDRADRSRIFEPFCSLWSEKRRGAGMGLALARQIVGELDGDILIDDGHHIGCVMRIALPACRRDPSPDDRTRKRG